MDPRTALLQQETDDSKGFRNKSIGMHNLRAKLREQLKGYSHVRGFPLEPEYKRVDAADTLTARRDSIRRRNSSVSKQAEIDSAEEPKYKPRRPRKKQESLLVPRLLWFSVYLSLCFVAFKGMKYFTSETQVKLCQACSGQCGVLDEEFTIPVDSLGDLPFGTVFPQQTNLQCRSSMCVPGYVSDPKALCRVVSDEALLYHTRRLLMAEDSVDEHNERFLNYFRSRALAENGIAGALSPNQAPVPTPTTPAATRPPVNTPTPTTVPTTPIPTTPAATIPATPTPTNPATPTPTTPAATRPPVNTPTPTVPTTPIPTTPAATPAATIPATPVPTVPTTPDKTTPAATRPGVTTPTPAAGTPATPTPTFPGNSGPSKDTPATTPAATPTPTPATPVKTTPAATSPPLSTPPAVPPTSILTPVTRQPDITPVTQTIAPPAGGLVQSVGDAVKGIFGGRSSEDNNQRTIAPTQDQNPRTSQTPAPTSDDASAARAGRSSEDVSTRTPAAQAPTDTTSPTGATPPTAGGSPPTSATPPTSSTPPTVATPPTGGSPPPSATPPTGGSPPPSATPPATAPPPSQTTDLLSSGAYYTDKSVEWADAANTPGGDGGNCNTLQYAPMEGNGYANLTMQYYKGIRNVQTYGQCCGICGADPRCVAWTRVAGGDPSVRNCYLKATMVPGNNGDMYNWQPSDARWPPNPEVRYTGGVPIMFESGTMGQPLPDVMYGCPYPPVASGVCTVPAGCNCGGGVCYGACTAPSVANKASSGSADKSSSGSTALPPTAQSGNM